MTVVTRRFEVVKQSTTREEDFVVALGVTVRRVDPDGRCLTYDRFNRIAYACRIMCRDEGQLFTELIPRVNLGRQTPADPLDENVRGHAGSLSDGEQ